MLTEQQISETIDTHYNVRLRNRYEVQGMIGSLALAGIHAYHSGNWVHISKDNATVAAIERAYAAARKAGEK